MEYLLVIKKETKLTPADLNRIADWLNDTHDAGAIHSSYWEIGKCKGVHCEI